MAAIGGRIPRFLMFSLLAASFVAGVSTARADIAATPKIAQETQAGKRAVDRGNNPAALQHYRNALERQQMLPNPSPLDTVRHQTQIAIVHLNLKQYAEARAVLMQALPLAEQSDGVDGPATGAVYQLFGTLSSRQGDWVEALAWYDKAWRAREHDRDADTAATAHDIAEAYDARGQYDEALAWYEKARVIRERIKDPLLSATYEGIAETRAHMGERANAKQWQSKAQFERGKDDASNNLLAAMEHHNAAVHYLQQHDLNDAMQSFEKSRAILERVVGVENADTAMTYRGIGMVHAARGDYRQAMTWYDKALAIQEKLLGSDNASTAMTYNNAAVALVHLGDIPKALQYLQSAAATLERTAGPHHPNTASAYRNIAWAYSKQQDKAKAAEWRQKAALVAAGK